MARSVRKRRKASCLALLFLLLLLLGAALLAALGGLVLLTVQRPAGLGLVVALQSPGLAGGRAEINRPLDVQAVARNAAGVTRLEVYADGMLAGAQATSLATGSNPLLYRQPWTPLAPGRHALVARAYDNTGRFTDSNVVYVDVVDLIQTTEQLATSALAAAPGGPPPSLNDVAAGWQLPLAQLAALNPGLLPDDPGAPLLPGQSLTLPRAPATAPVLAPAAGPISGSPPVPSGLVVTLDCSSARLTWAPAAGIRQYSVYRLGPSDSAPQLRATVTNPADADALAGLGEYRYQVAAVQAGLEALGPLVVATTPATCLPPALASGTVDVHLAAVALDTDAAFEGVYCYLSVDGSPFERVPRADFSSLMSSANGRHYDLAAQLPNRGQFLLASHSSAAPVRLTAECWGRSGPLTTPLGVISTNDPPAKWDGAQQQSWAGTAGALVALLSRGHTGTAAPLPAGAQVQLTYSLNAAVAAAIPQSAGDVYLLEAFGLPAPEHLRIENSTLACAELPTAAQQRQHDGPFGFGLHGPRLSPGGWSSDPTDAKGNPLPPDPLRGITDALRQALGEQAACQISAMLGGAPILLWDWHDDAGHFTEASLAGYHVVANLTDLERPNLTDFNPRLPRFEPAPEGLYWERDVRPGMLKAALARLTDVPCGVRIDFTVTAVYAGAQSLPSDALSFESEPCNNAAQVTVSIDTLIVGPVNDHGDPCPIVCSPDTLEAVGYLFAGSGRWEPQRQWISDPGETRLDERREGAHIIANTEVVRPPNPINLLRAGRYAWSDQLLGQVEPFRGSQVFRGRRNNQRWTFLARATDTIPIGARLDDWDYLRAQPFCYTDYEIPARRATVWFTTDETISMRDTRGEATCEITVHITGARIDYSAHP